MLGQDLSVIAPELILALYAMGALLWGAFAKRDMSRLILRVTVSVLVIVGLWVGFGSGTSMAFEGSFINDGFARFSKVLILFGAAATLAMSLEFLARTDLLKYEFPVLVTLAVIGMMVMVSASDLIVLYLGLELQSLALYVIASFRRDSLRSTEAGLKYFVLGALSSGLLLYGASLTYGFSGTTNFAGIGSIVGSGEHMATGLVFGLVFIISGLAFKVSAVPFHMWTPDVYEGAPTPVTAFFSTAPKVAAAALMARVLFDAFGDAVSDWQQVLALISLFSMFLGSFAAIGQTNIKRLMAYSSIGHMGYALMGLAAGTQAGAEALLVYLAIYVTMNVGVFAFILNMTRDGKQVSDIASLGLYSRVEPARAAALAVLMFSLAGVPPLIGFFGKFYVVSAAVDAGLVWLAVAGVVASVIGAYYYLRIVYLMYFGEAAEPMDGRMPPIHWGLLGASSLAMIFGIVNLFGVDSLAAAAAASLVQ
ncbi:NADH-quinone oxidoreductase subunit NuoN [Amaricoccus macauensis]|uniref:NADH-quinone oxidoreductase subunit NuoN n=1 Tax=Amaricoccus macauensis TaxID=57001 RepID=UPI003C7CC289